MTAVLVEEGADAAEVAVLDVDNVEAPAAEEDNVEDSIEDVDCA